MKIKILFTLIKFLIAVWTIAFIGAIYNLITNGL